MLWAILGLQAITLAVAVVALVTAHKASTNVREEIQVTKERVRTAFN